MRLQRRVIQGLELGLATLLILLLLLLIHRFFLTIVRVDGPSMNPTLPTAAVVVVERSHAMPRRGDIVGIRLSSGQQLVKRIIGLPTEQISIHDNQVLLGDLVVREPYIADLATEGNVALHLGADEYFALGDNRPDSLDSREYGAIRGSEIIGPVRAVLWPGFKIF